MDALNLDFAQFGSKYFIVTADNCSGFVMAAATPNQSTDSALQFLHHIGSAYSYPTKVLLDNGLTFRENFSTELKKYGIFHKTSSPYMQSANGAAERAVHSVKSYLCKLGSLQQKNCRLSSIALTTRLV